MILKSMKSVKNELKLRKKVKNDVLVEIDENAKTFRIKMGISFCRDINEFLY